MTSVGDLRAALAAVSERTAHAQGQVELARGRLDEVARILAELSPGSHEALPRDEVDRARRELDDLRAVIAAAAAAVTDLGNRL